MYVDNATARRRDRQLSKIYNITATHTIAMGCERFFLHICSFEAPIDSITRLYEEIIFQVFRFILAT